MKLVLTDFAFSFTFVQPHAFNFLQLTQHAFEVMCVHFHQLTGLRTGLCVKQLVIIVDIKLYRTLMFPFSVIATMLNNLLDM